MQMIRWYILHLRQYWPFPSMYLDNRPFSLLDGQKNT